MQTSALPSEITFEELDARLAAVCGEALKTLLRSAEARADADLAARIRSLSEAKLVIHANGDTLQVDLVAPDAAGRAVLLLGLTAMTEVSPCELH